MKLRTELRETLNSARMEEFVEDLKKHLREVYPEKLKYMTERLFDRRVRYGIRRAQGRGLTWPYSISIFVKMMFLIGALFDEYPAVRRILESPELPPDERIDAMMEKVSTEQWADAQDRAEDSDWAPADKSEA